MKRSPMPRRRKRLQSNAAALAERERRTILRRRADPEHHEVLTTRLTIEARKQDAWHQARDAVIFRSRGLCEANWEGVCRPGPHQGHHVHHRRLRSQGGSDDVDNLMHVCGTVHKHAHDVDRAGAEERGIILRAWVYPPH